MREYICPTGLSLSELIHCEKQNTDSINWWKTGKGSKVDYISYVSTPRSRFAMTSPAATLSVLLPLMVRWAENLVASKVASHASGLNAPVAQQIENTFLRS